jgi:predicted Zn-ribbon and HTH transcriptional regulator
MLLYDLECSKCGFISESDILENREHSCPTCKISLSKVPVFRIPNEYLWDQYIKRNSYAN